MRKRLVTFLGCLFFALFTIDTQARTENFAVGEWNEQDASTIEKAYTYYKSRNYSEALKWFEKAAEEGNQIAWIEIGDFYFFGLGVDIDYKKALEYYNKSSIKDDPNVYYNLAEIYAEGLDGSQPNASKAEEYFEKAVQGKSADAVKLRTKEEKAKVETASIMKQALAYVKNENYEEAIPLLEKAADQGNTDAMYELARYYNNDESTIYEAYYWSNLCFPYKRANCIEIFNSLWDAYALDFSITFVEDLYEPSSLAIVIGDIFYKDYDDENALKWYLRAGDLGHIDGYYMVGLIYAYSEVLPIDIAKAKYYLKLADEKGHEKAKEALEDLE